MFTIDDIKKIAKLANLNLTVDEETKFAGQLSAVISYVEKLKEVDTSNVVLDSSKNSDNNRFKDDSVGDHLSTEQALFNAKNKDSKYFLVDRKLD
jgi:aspartyl-tRNA(Asn)/glutamyl-tRNA(Gln) amidotransferase subunit C